MLLETETRQTDEHDLARALIRLYGHRAEMVAEDHAARSVGNGDIAAYCQWWRVRDIVSGMRPHSPGKEEA